MTVRSMMGTSPRWRRVVLLGGAFLAVGAMLLPTVGASAPATLIICAPGYPGTTEEAQPSMDAFASAVASAAGWTAGELRAEYHEDEARGLARLERADAAFALVPLPFYVEHHARLGLAPRLTAVAQGGEALETWTLVAGRDRVRAPADLGGFELVSIAGYAPRFVRGAALGSWGALPDSVTLRPSGQVLSALRRSANGEPVAVLLDGAQATALASLPFATSLQVVTRSPAVPAALFCTVGNRVEATRAAKLDAVLSGLASTTAGADALGGVRLSGFSATDRARLESAVRASATVVLGGGR